MRSLIRWLFGSKELKQLREEAAWIRRKLGLPVGCGMFHGNPSLAGELHVLCSDADGMRRYIRAYKCNDKQAEIAMLGVELKRLRYAVAGVIDELDKVYPEPMDPRSIIFDRLGEAYSKREPLKIPVE